MLFPPCTDPLMKRDPEDVNCLYSPNKLAKIVWKQIENGAPRLFSFIQRFAFRVDEYSELLLYYNTHHRSDHYLYVGVRAGLDIRNIMQYAIYLSPIKYFILPFYCWCTYGFSSDPHQLYFRSRNNWKCKLSFIISYVLNKILLKRWMVNCQLLRVESTRPDLATESYLFSICR